MTKQHKFIVSGRGRFPVDMLRYDCAWPLTGPSADGLLDNEQREVTLVSHKAPTNERWRSFGWVVTDHERS